MLRQAGDSETERETVVAGGGAEENAQVAGQQELVMSWVEVKGNEQYKGSLCSDFSDTIFPNRNEGHFLL